MLDALARCSSRLIRALAPIVLAAVLAGWPAFAEARSPAVGTPDRWVEIDLYWFDADAPERSAARFWDRYAPLYRGVRGYRGVVLNVGFTVDYVMAFCRLDQQIELPAPSGQELGEPTVPLLGDTAQRQAAWRARVTRQGRGETAQAIGYGRWTYASLARLARALRSEAAARGIAGFRVGSFVVAFNSAYGEVARFARAHPEAWTRWGKAVDMLDTSAYFDPAARLRADRGCFAGIPGGIAGDMPVSAAFGAQWGALSKAVGLDALMLRDGFGLPRAYVRDGPWGAAVPDRATAGRMTDGVLALLRALKRGNPRALTMMWSSAATATSDWRANGLDLERVAGAGDLDIFVDQTWAGAWGEAGARQQTFWNAPILGWTYQLGSLLLHRAVLAGTNVRHYFLTETFDAWESWDTIHGARDRLRWAIWAYSHAAAKTPRGLAMPAGSYVAWGNRGHDLLPASDVSFLADTLDAAARDAAATVDIRGATLVYSRDAMAAQLDRLSPGFDVRDRTDEQIGSIAKWPFPILSATRAEWLPQIRSDLLLFGATAGLNGATRDAIVARARDGQAMAFLGAPHTATDAAFVALAGVTTTRFAPAVNDVSLRATPGAAAPAAAWVAPFDAPPPQQSNAAAARDRVYAFADSVGLARRSSDGLDVVLWDPPSIRDDWYLPLKAVMNGDPAPYALAAATLDAQLAAAGAPHGIVDVAQSGTLSAWVLRDGTVRILAGNLEEGLRDDADRSRKMAVGLPPAWRAAHWRGEWPASGSIVADGDGLTLELPPQGSMLLSARPPAR